MATANPPRRARAPAKPSRRGLRIALVLAGVIVAALIAFWTPLNGYAITGASYGARVACSCHFVGGRSIGDCKQDFESGMELVTLSADDAAKTVTARFPLLATQTARLVPGEGCRLEPWRD